MHWSVRLSLMTRSINNSFFDHLYATDKIPVHQCYWEFTSLCHILDAMWRSQRLWHSTLFFPMSLYPSNVGWIFGQPVIGIEGNHLWALRESWLTSFSMLGIDGAHFLHDWSLDRPQHASLYGSHLPLDWEQDCWWSSYTSPMFKSDRLPSCSCASFRGTSCQGICIHSGLPSHHIQAWLDYLW